MRRAVFDLAGVMELVEHAMRSPAWMAEWDGPAKGPGLVFVGDQGVYLMSNGLPKLEGDVTPNRVVYAEGMDPVKDGETWWDAKRDVFGGDDGADTLPWCEAIVAGKAAMEAEGKRPTKLVLILDADDTIELALS